MLQRFVSVSACVALTLCAACSDAPTPPPGAATTGTRLIFELDSSVLRDDRFFDAPFPSDLRLSAEGTPDVDGFPNPSALPLLDGFLAIARQRAGFPTQPVVYFRFDGPLAPLEPDVAAPYAADPASSILLVDVDPDSPARGALVPVVAATPPEDPYTPPHVLAVAARPGFVLHPERRYAVVVRRALGDAAGAPLAASPLLAELARGQAPATDAGERARTTFEPLWPTLTNLGVSASDVAAATVFTTGDVVRDTFELSEKVRAAYAVTIDGLAIDPDDGASHPEYCELHGHVVYPQFQRGTPPFDTEGLFELGDDGLPVHQRDEEAPVVVLLPKQKMPVGGFPLDVFWHGSGGSSTASMDPLVADGQPGFKNAGPAPIVTARGIAVAGSAMPVNPERLPGASDIAYLNFDNLAAARDTFRQGILEQRLFLDALLDLEIDPSTLGACIGPELPAGESAFHFRADAVVGQGQSMGGMYTNLIGAVEPRIRAVVPTGAGGYWTYFFLETTYVANIEGAFRLVLATQADLTFLHPVFALAQTGFEPIEPYASMPRLALRPLPGHPTRPVFEPVGRGDHFFPQPIYDGAALAYGNRQAGEERWPQMQAALALDGRDGLLEYPVEGDATAEDGTKYTGVVVQYEGDGTYDPHAIYATRDDLKYQYGCFFRTFLDTGSARVLAPRPLGDPCQP